LFLVGLSGFAAKKDPDYNGRKTTALGVIFMAFSLLFTGIQFIVEEALLSKFATHPLKVVGFEGMWGTIVYIITLIIMQNVGCEYFQSRGDLCAENDLGEWRLEDTLFAFRQMVANGALFFYVIAVTFTISFYNFCGVCVTR